MPVKVRCAGELRWTVRAELCLREYRNVPLVRPHLGDRPILAIFDNSGAQ